MAAKIQVIRFQASDGTLLATEFEVDVYETLLRPAFGNSLRQDKLRVIDILQKLKQQGWTITPLQE